MKEHEDDYDNNTYDQQEAKREQRYEDWKHSDERLEEE